MADTSEITHNGNGNTTFEGPSAFVSFALNDNSSAYFGIRAIARCSANSDTRTWAMLAFAKRSGATAVIQSQLIAQFGDAGASAWAITIAQNGDSIDILSTGQADTTIAWYVTAVVMYIAD